MRSSRNATVLLAPLAGLLLGACDSEPTEQTTLRVSVYGEEFTEDRIPTEAFIDGWEVEFSRFTIAISDVEVDGEPLDGSFVLDLTEDSQGAGHELGTMMVPALDSPSLSFSVQPPTAATPVSATDEDVAEMVAQGSSVVAEGQATRGDEVIRFSWSFATTTRYAQCEGTADLASDPEPTTELTIHVDHLFYDDLDSEEPNVAFDLIASADADGDGEVTAAELRAVDITSETRYQVGSREITDLWSFIEAQIGTLGHIDGEGHCEFG